jgi:glycosyltransferase involved in cell wall biosynthesis
MQTHSISSPLVSVVIGAYNAAGSLSATLDSVLAQSVTELECIVVDDASQDGTSDCVRTVAARDPRVRLVSLESNGGLTRALVRGVEEARGIWLARIDAGDTWHPEKLRRQFAFLDQHSDVGLVGCRSEDANIQTGVVLRKEKPECHDKIMDSIWHGCPFIHSTVLARLDLVRDCGNYDPSFRYAQDYDLYFRLLQMTRGHNLPEVLCQRTTHGVSALSYAHWKEQLGCSLRIRLKYLRNFHRPWSDYFCLLPDLAKLAVPAGVKGLKQRLRGDAHAR